MAYQIRIKRQSAPDTKSYWQEFSYDGSADASVAAVLNELNGRMPLTLPTAGTMNNPKG